MQSKAAEVGGVLENLVDGMRFGEVVGLMSEVDTAEIFPHTADTVQEDLEVTVVKELKTVVAVQERSSLVEAPLACTKDSGTAWRLVDPSAS